jgi:hypothetical protein
MIIENTPIDLTLRIKKYIGAGWFGTQGGN